ncbi:MAG: hypothetical protein Q9184_001323 [Pyrenodesmia sp. 2 TL-2023]
MPDKICLRHKFFLSPAEAIETLRPRYTPKLLLQLLKICKESEATLDINADESLRALRLFQNGSQQSQASSFVVRSTDLK